MEVAVLGADAAGCGIVQICAAAGHAVALHDTEANAVMDGIDAVDAGLDDAVSAGELSAEARDSAVDRMEGTTGLEAAVGGAEVVVDATAGDREQRRTLWADMEDVVDEETLLATSATTVSVTAVATGLHVPERAVGLHFVDPPAVSLVEVVLAEQTGAESRDRAVEFVQDFGESVVVQDTPGFACSRLALALSVEAMTMVDERVASVAAIDRALEAGHDHPQGPLAAADAAGLDARLAQLEYLANALGERFAPPPVLRRKVERGDLGRKTGEGFYVWEGGEPVEPGEPDPCADSPVGPDRDRL